MLDNRGRIGSTTSQVRSSLDARGRPVAYTVAPTGASARGMVGANRPTARALSDSIGMDRISADFRFGATKALGSISTPSPVREIANRIAYPGTRKPINASPGPVVKSRTTVASSVHARPGLTRGTVKRPKSTTGNTVSVSLKVARAGSQGGIPLGTAAMQGDPGLFGSIFSGAKRLAGAGLSTLTGGPAAGVSSLLRGGRGAPSAPMMGQVAPRGAPISGMRAQVQRALPGGETGMGIGCPKGHRPNKSDYFLRDGTFVAAGTRCVKTRRRNPANARATSRAISRVDGAKRMQHTLAGIETKKYTKAGKRKHPHS